MIKPAIARRPITAKHRTANGGLLLVLHGVLSSDDDDDDDCPFSLSILSDSELGRGA